MVKLGGLVRILSTAIVSRVSKHLLVLSQWVLHPWWLNLYWPNLWMLHSLWLHMLGLHPMELLLVAIVRLSIDVVCLRGLLMGMLLLKDDIRVIFVNRLDLLIASIITSVVAARNHGQAAEESEEHVLDLVTSFLKHILYSVH